MKMTPAEEYEQKRQEAENLIRQYAPARLHKELIALLRPAIALNATHVDEGQIPVGASKFGGAPDVPEGFEWPMWNDRPLGFLAQINLEEVAPFDVEGLLPQAGLLSFFYHQDSSGGNTAQAGWPVIHLQSSNINRCPTLSDEMVWHIAPHTLSMTILPDLPSSLSLLFPESTTEECHECSNLWRNWPFTPPSWNKMLCYSDDVDGFDEGTFSGSYNLLNPTIASTEPQDWRVLLQLDTENSLVLNEPIVWFVKISYGITKRDLANRQFGEAQFAYKWS